MDEAMYHQDVRQISSESYLFGMSYVSTTCSSCIFTITTDLIADHVWLLSLNV